MAKVNLVQKKARMGQREIIKYQLLTHCFLNDVQLSNNELDCLTLLGLYAESELAEFCKIAVDENIFKHSQTVRNFLTKAGQLKLILKQGTMKKIILLNPDLKIQATGNILLDYKMVYAAQE